MKLNKIKTIRLKISNNPKGDVLNYLTGGNALKQYSSEVSEELDGNLKVYDEKGLAVAGTGFGIHVFNDNSGSIHLDDFNNSNTGNNVKLLRNINLAPSQ